MSNILTLIKYDFLMVFNQFNKKRKNAFFIILIIIMLAVLMSASYLLNSITALEGLLNSGFEHLILVSPVIMFISTIGLFTISKSTAVKDKNTNLLLALPIKKYEIILAKTIASTLFNIVLGIIFILPTSILYVIDINNNFMIILNTLITILLISFSFSGIGYLFNSFINKYISKFKMFKIIRTVIVITSLILFVYITNALTVDEATLRVPIISHIIEIILFSNFINYLILISTSTTLLLLGVFVYARTYGITQSTFKSKKKQLNFKQNSIVSSLLKKEFRNYFNSSIYLFQTIIGHVLIIGGAISLIFINTDYIEFIVYSFICFSLSLTCTTNSSISLEGENLWILKSTPVNPKYVLLSKALMNIILLFVSTTISFIILLISRKIDISTSILLYILSLSVSLFISFGGLLINLLLPKLKFTSEMEVVKQSAASITSVLFFIFLLGFPSIILMVFAMSGTTILLNYILIINIIYILIFSMILILTTLTKGVDKYNKL